MHALGDKIVLINECVHIRYGLRLKHKLSIENIINLGQPDESSPLDELHVLV
jgi:hypothetical protein